MKSLFDFIGWTEIEMYSRLSRNEETGDSDPAGGVEVSRRRHWTNSKSGGDCPTPTSAARL
ncbi:hypothetical protein [Mesobacillus selenatarsenatis]|uniref:hypothetical protein n=1 Tax=Mesobacillus selenatarsenatis TaxID=388741 RepID=UPI0005A9D557|nr:hypothetical protein [Mesobacillus selenatarsenatis]